MSESERERETEREGGGESGRPRERDGVLLKRSCALYSELCTSEVRGESEDVSSPVQGYLALKKQRPPSTLQ